MGGKSAPPTPNYTQAAQQQGIANTETAYAQNTLNNPNMTTPYGTSTYTQGQQIGTNPDGSPIYANGSIVQTLSPAEQQLLTSGQQVQQSSLNILNQDAGNISNALLQPFGYTGQSIPTGGFNAGPGQMQYSVGNAGPIATSINTNGVQAIPQAGQGYINNVEQAQYAEGAQFLNPQFQQAQTALTGQLANEGIEPGSAAYNTAVNNLALQQQGAYSNLTNQAITGGQQAAQALYGEQLSGNTTGFGEAQAQAAQQNSAQSQLYQQLLSSLGANNAAVTSQANIGQAQAAAQLAEEQAGYQQYANNRTMPINMLTALLGSSQVQNPTFNSYSPTQIAQTPIMTGAQLQGQQAAATNSANAGKLGSLLGAGGQIGAAAMMPVPTYSDRRLKSNIVHLGKYGPFNWYEYNIKGQRKQGVMADEVMPIVPQAVSFDSNGYQMVDYKMLGL